MGGAACPQTHMQVRAFPAHVRIGGIKNGDFSMRVQSNLLWD